MTKGQGTSTETRADFNGPRFLWLTLQLALLLGVMYRFRIQEAFGFLELLPLLFWGFVVHALLPLRWRLACFCLLSMASLLLVVPFPHGLTLIAMGLGLIGLCHLPIAFRWRVLLLLVFGASLAYVRAGLWAGDPGRILETRLLPLLGALFMYRIVVYMYDLNTEKRPASIWERLSYFFMLPNAGFLLFPVVDYSTFRRSHFKGEAFDIYQRGLTWIYRGLTHIVAYRIIYQYLIPDPEQIEGLGGIVAFMLTTYLLYLRVSGQFHIIVGVLCLFGFNLPGTHRLYYLATSFNDFWRRINIYWKDYMLKLFFYPTYMRLRGFSMSTRLVLSTLVVFIGTWLLHPYQHFWIRGSFPITIKDGIFWGVLGVLVIFNSLSEAKVAKQRTARDGWQWREAYVLSAKTLGTFLFICVLWSFWSAHTIEEWTSMLQKAKHSSAGAWLGLALGLVLVLHLGVLLKHAYSAGTRLNALRLRCTVRDQKLSTLLGAGLLLLISWSAEQGALGDRMEGLLANLGADRLNASDIRLERRGYYEGLNDSSSFTSALSARMQAPKGPEWLSIRESGVARSTADALEYELVPSYRGTWKDADFSTNEWGMRDRAYSKAKPAGSFRIALVGASMEVAAGVALEATYENVLERKLNADYVDAAHPHFEVLNFAVGGYSMVQKALVVRERVPAFEPDLVLLAMHSTEERRLYNHLVKLIEQGFDPGALLRAPIARAGITKGMGAEAMREALLPLGDEIIAASLGEIQKSCAAMGVPLCVLFLPLSEDSRLEDAYFEQLLAMVIAAGIEPLWIKGAFDGYDEKEILLAPDWDRLHLSVLGNRLLAEVLSARLAEYLDLSKN